MKKITFLFALLCASMMTWAQYCDYATGHQNNADFGDADGRILLSLEPTNNADEFKLTIKPNYANGATKQLDYLYVIAGGNNPYPAEAGEDGGAGYDELSVIFTNANAKTSFTIQWSHPDWAGRWECALNDVDLDALVSCIGGGGSGACTDNVKPSISDATISNITYNSAVLTITATDNEAVTRYVVKNGDAEIASTTNNEISLTNLSSNTTYDNIKVYAYDECNNESKVFEVDDFKTNMLQYCQFETGHLKDANFGDINGRILLTIRQISASAVGVTVEPNSTKVFDYVEVIVAGVGKSIGTIGEDIPTNEEIVFDGLSSLDFTISVSWHHKGWDPVARWTTQNFQVAPTELCNAMSSILVNANVNNVEMGTASVNKSEAEKGDEVTFTAVANDGYMFVNWTAGSTIVSTNPIYTTVVDANTTLTANFRKLNNNYCNAEMTKEKNGENYTIYVTYKKTSNENEYKLVVRSAKEMTGFGGTSIRCSGGDIDIRTKGVLENKNTLSCTLESTTEPNMYTPLYVIFKDGGEVTFDALTNPEFAIACDDDNVEVESIALDPAELTLEVGKNKTLIPIFTPAYAVDQTITWQSSKESIVSVTDGVISANAEGEAVITATSENGKTATCAITVIASLPTAPLTAAPVPTWPADQVKSLYSDSYTSTTTWNYLAGWGQTTQLAAEAIDGNNMLHYSNFNYLGWDIANGTPINALNMEYLHIDIWADQDGQIGIVPIFGGAGLTTDDSKRKIVTLKGQQWNSFDLKLDTEFAGLDLSSIWQVKLDNGTITAFYIDNAYFYRTTPIVDDVVPTNLTVSVNKESFYSIALDVQAEDNMAAVSFSIKNGETEVATGAAASGATTTITVNNLTPNTNYTFTVIAKDEAGNESEPKSVTAKTLAVPDPAPAPTYPADLVKSLYSNAYAPAATLGNTNENWWQAPTNSEVDLGEGDMALLYENIPATSTFGWAFGTFDAIGYQTLHMSIYPLNSGTIEIYPVIQPEGEFHRTSQTLVANQWNDVVIDLSDKTFTTFTQLGFTNYSALGAFFIDNVYFYKAPEAVNFADDATDNSTIVANNADKFANVTINRSILANGEWFTLCLPFDMDEDKVFEVFGNSTIATLVSSEDRGSIIHLNFDYVKTIEAGNAYMIKPGKDFVAGTIIEGVTIKNVNPENLKSTCELMHFQGVFDQYLLEGDNKRFVSANNYLYSPADGGTTMGAFRCYFTIPVESQALVGSKAARIVFGPQVATGTENVQSDQVPSAKVIIDGTLYIIRDGRTYNAQGQLVK